MLRFAGDGVDAGPIETVRYSFEAKGVADAWRVHALYLDEGLSMPYTAELSLISEKAAVNPSDLLGKSCLFAMSRGPLERRLGGVLQRVEHLGNMGEHVLARVTLVPALAALAHRSSSRMFQNMTVPEIAERVLAAGLDPYHRTARLELDRTYPKREYCLQFGESDLAFVSRLLAEEGIFFWFDQSGDHEQVVLHDRNGACQPFSSDGHSVDVMGPGAELAGKEALREFFWTEELRPSAVVLRDFDWTRPAFDLTATKRETAAPEPEREMYAYSPPLTLSEYDPITGRYTLDDGSVKARLRAEEQGAQRQSGVGDGYVTRFAAGTTFELAGHSTELDRRYLITSVVHEGSALDELVDFSGAAGQGSGAARGDPGGGERYRNRFTCIPAEVPYRPARAVTRPRIPGLQSALVVGPANEEIHTDAHGRIRVRFPWDRDAKGDEMSSFWVRVAQVWSGAGWGFMFIPRVGMEVLIAFMDGDPDRPLVVGCAHNGANPPPYVLPGDKTRSTIRTASSPGNNGFNELRFEDAAGSEELFLHAQKDMNVVVLHDGATKIGHDEKTLVGRDRSRTVLGKETVSILKNQDETIGGNKSETVGIASAETVTAAKTLTIGGAYNVSVGGAMNESVDGLKGEDIGGAKVVSVGASSVENIKENKSIKTGGNISAKAQKEVSIKSIEGTAITAGKDIAFRAGESFNVGAGKEGTIEIKEGLVLKCGGATISLKKNGDITIKGSKIRITGDREVILKGSKITGN